MSEVNLGLRVDKWLWHARFFKTRSLAAKLVQSGKLRLNRDLISKSSRNVIIGDVLTFTKARETRVIQVCELGTRRGPALEAQTLFTDLAPAKSKPAFTTSLKPDQKPTAHERRALQKFKQDLEKNNY